ncbi:hypothetical protein BGZ76_003517, partial [Entomortierella beljakovae]
DTGDTVDNLKKAIKEEKSKTLADIDSSDLILFQVAVPDEGSLGKAGTSTLLIIRSAEVVGTAPVKKTIRVIVQRPSASKTPLIRGKG